MITNTYNTNLKQMTTFGLPAECGRLVEYDTEDDLVLLHHEGTLDNALHLGGGSNMLFTTGGFSGTVLHSVNRNVRFSEPDADGTVTVTVGAGCTLDHLCALACERSLWGLENLSGIPGEIGGAAVQNVGAYGTEFKDVAVSLRCFDTLRGTFVTLSVEECAYGYRDSIFKHLPTPGSLIVVEATLRLTTLPSPRLGYAALASRFASADPSTLTPSMLREEVIALRNGKLPSPTLVGSAGSFFKNPVVTASEHRRIEALVNQPVPGHVTPTGEVKLSAAWLIDHAGCKGMTHGGAAVWHLQPLVLVNATGQATGADVVALEEMVRSAVARRFGVELSSEVIHI